MHLRHNDSRCFLARVVLVAATLQCPDSLPGDKSEISESAGGQSQTEQRYSVERRERTDTLVTGSYQILHVILSYIH